MQKKKHNQATVKQVVRLILYKSNNLLIKLGSESYLVFFKYSSRPNLLRKFVRDARTMCSLTLTNIIMSTQLHVDIIINEWLRHDLKHKLKATAMQYGRS